MKKLAAIFVTLAFVSSASAQVISNPTTNARMEGLGVSNWQIEDDFNIWINPAQLKNYKNAVYGELGTDPCGVPGGACGSGISDTGHNERNATSAWGGMNMDAPYGGWGVYLGRPYAGPLAGIAAVDAEGNSGGAAPTTNRFDLFYSSQGLPLGFYLSYADRSEETKTGAGKLTSEASEINLGVGGLIMNNMLDLALNVGLPSSKMQDTSAGTKTDDDASVNISLLARHHGSAGGNGKLLTTLQILLGDSSTKTSGGAKLDSTSTTISLDTALNSNPNPDTLLVVGIGIVSTESEAKTKPTGSKVETSILTIPVNLAVEHQTFKKLQTRVGLSKNIYSSFECKGAASTSAATCTSGAFTANGDKFESTTTGPATVSMGLGWAVADNLMLDAVINQDILFTGTYVVSGVPETLNSMLSATYRFN